MSPVDCGLRPAGVMTVTSTVPAAEAGTVAITDVDEAETMVPGTVPK